MAVSFEVPMMHVNYSDFRLRNPLNLLAWCKHQYNFNLHLNILKGYEAYSNNQNKRKLQD